jgi:hypothetical protein
MFTLQAFSIKSYQWLNMFLAISKAKNSSLVFKFSKTIKISETKFAAKPPLQNQ